MSLRCLFISVLLLMIVGCSGVENTQSSNRSPISGITLIESHHPALGEIGIPYTKYRLANGLVLILTPDHSDPLVRVDVTYHVGSSRENPARTGFAHFFEHMMFQGSKHVGDQQHFKLITEAGGILNGSTNRDRTNYYETVPANQLEKVLWLESDRMGFLLDSVSQKKFEIQRSTVKNERAQNYENKPYGMMWEKMDEAMYPANHPYSWQPIGYVSDLDKADVNDLKAFFLKWYGPNNAVLTIGGDFDTKETLKWVLKYFGSIPPGPDVPPVHQQPVVLPEDRFITVEDNIKQPMVVIGWATALSGTDDEMNLSALAKIVGSGENSLFYQKLVKTQKALDAGAFQKCGELSCSFYLYAMSSSQGKSKLKELKNEMLSIVATLSKQGVDSTRLKEIQGMAKANAVFATESVAGKVSQLASNQTFWDQPDRINTELEQLSGLTTNSIKNALDSYLLNQHYVVMSVVPNGKANISAEKANFVFHRDTAALSSELTSDPIELRVPKDKFDRSVMPQVSSPVKPVMPTLYRDYLDNGIEIVGTESKETPTVLIQISLPAGNRYVPEGKEGLAQLTASMLQQGSVLHSAEEMESQLDQLGSVISVSTGTYTSSVVVSVVKKNLDATLSILNDALVNPRFEKSDLQRIKQQMIQEVMYRTQKVTWLASQASREILYKGTLFARDMNGTIASIKSLTLNDVKQFYNANYTPNGAQVAIVGDLSEKEALNKLQFLTDWTGNPAPLLNPQTLPKIGGQHIYLVNKPGSVQSIVRFIRPAMPFDATGEMFLTQLANFNLAGNFNSRMNQELREKKGYTYGMSGYVASNREVGTVIFNAPVRRDATVDTIKEMTNQLKDYAQNGIRDDELTFMRLAVGQQEALAYETPGQKAQLISGLMTYGLDKDYLQQRNNIVATVSKDTINQLAKKWFDPHDYQIIVVGDAKTLRPQLKALNLPVVDLEFMH
ncbi:M16 family metallopeptidase [Vibrio viridaestus]|uniref:Insulinase family protein n=1 Tax=Vibrio viridaestus TaxID=2487322 RepID=A0A3N9U4H6_9VIBR|nr:pitrilysin family protein [Vibrio viridaestus]RQW62936.1 insulinase family protein [Vibrio viridaestus]